MLFSAVNQTLQSFGKDQRWRLEGQTGFILKKVASCGSQTVNRKTVKSAYVKKYRRAYNPDIAMVPLDLSPRSTQVPVALLLDVVMV